MMINWWNPVSVMGKWYRVVVPLTNWRVQAFRRDQSPLSSRWLLPWGNVGGPVSYICQFFKRNKNLDFKWNWILKYWLIFKTHCIFQIKYICGPDATSYYPFFITVLYYNAFLFLPYSKCRSHLYKEGLEVYPKLFIVR